VAKTYSLLSKAVAECGCIAAPGIFVMVSTDTDMPHQPISCEAFVWEAKKAQY